MRIDTKIISEIGFYFKKSAENKAICNILDVIGSVRLQERQIGVQKMIIAILQYNILSIVKRFESYQTIGGLLNQTLSGTLELSVTSKIWALLLETIVEIAEPLSADVDDIIAAIAQNNPKTKFFFDNYMARQVG